MTHEPHRVRAISVPRLLSLAQVADHLGISIKSVRRLIECGALPAHRIGRQLRISEPDLAAFVATTRQQR